MGTQKSENQNPQIENENSINAQTTPQKSWVRRHPILTVIIGLVAISTLANLCDSNTTDGGKSDCDIDDVWICDIATYVHNLKPYRERCKNDDVNACRTACKYGDNFSCWEEFKRESEQCDIFSLEHKNCSTTLVDSSGNLTCSQNSYMGYLGCFALSQHYSKIRFDIDQKKDSLIKQNAFKSWLKACDHNDGQGCFLLALSSNTNSEQDSYAQKACDLYFAPGCFKLAQSKKDQTEQISHLKKACELKNSYACTKLGSKSISFDFNLSTEEKFKYLKMGCELKDTSACSELGKLYEKGEGIAQDLVKAKLLYKIACEYGNSEACKNLTELTNNPPTQVPTPAAAPTPAPAAPAPIQAEAASTPEPVAAQAPVQAVAAPIPEPAPAPGIDVYKGKRCDVQTISNEKHLPTWNIEIVDASAIPPMHKDAEKAHLPFIKINASDDLKQKLEDYINKNSSKLNIAPGGTISCELGQYIKTASNIGIQHVLCDNSESSVEFLNLVSPVDNNARVYKTKSFDHLFEDAPAIDKFEETVINGERGAYVAIKYVTAFDANGTESTETDIVNYLFLGDKLRYLTNWNAFHINETTEYAEDNGKESYSCNAKATVLRLESTGAKEMTHSFAIGK